MRRTESCRGTMGRDMLSGENSRAFGARRFFISFYQFLSVVSFLRPWVVQVENNMGCGPSDLTSLHHFSAGTRTELDRVTDRLESSDLGFRCLQTPLESRH